MKKPLVLLAACAALVAAVPLLAQPPLFTSALPKEEFAARRARVLQQIGDAVVVMPGAPETSAYEKFRQSNQFFYLTGIEVPRAILLMDGRTKTSTLYIQPTSAQMERSEGPLLKSGPDAERLTGFDHVLPHADFDKAAAALAGRKVYTTFRGETRGAGTPDREAAHAAARKADPWDRRPPREEWFRTRLEAKAPGVTFQDLDPILDAMRTVKSEREIALLRESSRIAGLAMMEAMRSAEPGMHEYRFTSPKYRDAAARFVDGYRARTDGNPRRPASLGHMVGMEVHDVQGGYDGEYKPGMVFTIEPALTIPEDRVYIRLEDMLVITPTGCENMSAFVPVDPDGIEKLMAEPGLAQAARKTSSSTR